MWARQLFRRIKEPMDLFQEKAPQLLKTAEAKRIIRSYNKVAKVLLEFEVLYHREWMRQIDCVRAGRSSSEHYLQKVLNFKTKRGILNRKDFLRKVLKLLKFLVASRNQNSSLF